MVWLSELAAQNDHTQPVCASCHRPLLIWPAIALCPRIRGIATPDAVKLEVSRQCPANEIVSPSPRMATTPETVNCRTQHCGMLGIYWTSERSAKHARSGWVRC